ncbi:MAG: hypothetical protein ACOC2C_01105 [Cyclonatronaceae bacterium]
MLLFSLFLYACSDEDNIVSPSFNTGGQNLSVDTLQVSDIDITELTTFTGNLSFFSAGKYDDAAFGELHSTAYITPGVARILNDDIIEDDAEMYLILDVREFFGNTDSTEAVASYELRYVTERWRTTSFNTETQPAVGPEVVATFDITAATDSVAIALPPEWISEFRSIFLADEEEREDLVRENEFGFAIVPAAESDAIAGFRSTFTQTDSLDVTEFSGSRFYVKNPEPEDDGGDNGDGDDDDGDNGDGDGDEDEPRTEFFVPLRGTGFNLSIGEGGSIPEGALPLMNTFQQVLRLDTGLDDEDFTEQIVSRAELIFYDFDETEQTLPPGHRRPASEQLLFYTLDETEREFEVIKTPIFEPTFREEDESYRVNITNFVEQVQLGNETTTEFFITPARNNGLIIPRLLAGPEAGARSPKLIITRINPEAN